MCALRTELLQGKSAEICRSCYYEDSLGKVSGRQKQLLKSAVMMEHFDSSFCASPHFRDFEYSFKNNGETLRTPVDLQIDLGNTCNSACIMCSPFYSSRLASDYQKLHSTDSKLFPDKLIPSNWADDPKLLDKFVDELVQLPQIKYIHFIGGETLYMPSFYAICDRLIAADLAKDISIGTTTNCTVYNEKLEQIIEQFQHVHLGLSVESFHRINDYVRWPSKIEQVQENINKFIDLKSRTNLHLSLRITPNVFTVYHLDTVFEFMIKHNIIAESCDILHEPAGLRIELLSKDLLKHIVSKIDQLIAKHNLQSSEHAIVNRRREDMVGQVIADVIHEYKVLLTNLTSQESGQADLVKFIRAFESIRNNSILDYLPEYEEFLRSNGY